MACNGGGKVDMINIILSFFIFIAACATVPVTGRKQLSFLPQGQLLTMSFDSYHQLLSQSKLSPDAVETDRVRKVGGDIAAAAEQFLKENGHEGEIKAYSWEFNLIEDNKMINAFCMPGGKVAVYSGILPVTRDSDGLAVVLGHEVAHAIANHGNERLSQMLLVQLGGITLDRALKEKPNETKNIFMAAYGVGTSIGILLPYSRTHESEADRIGLILMARAGYDPRSAVPFWKRMSGAGAERAPEFLSTHPAPERRISDIEKFLPEALKYYKKP